MQPGLHTRLKALLSLGGGLIVAFTPMRAASGGTCRAITALSFSAIGNQSNALNRASDAAVTISLRRTSQWEGGYNGEFKITNTGSTNLSNWSLVFDTPDRLSFWNAQVSVSGPTWTLKPTIWAPDLKPGASATFGFGATTTAGKGWNPPTSGLFNGKTVTINNGQATEISISLSPTTAVLEPSKAQTFMASVTGTSNTAVTWKATGGTINNGVFTAPATEGSYTVTATSAADATKSAKATVTVKKAGSGCTAPPSVPTGLASPSQDSTSVSLKWNPVTVMDGCTITYDVYQNGTKVLTVPTTTAIIANLKANNSYSFTVAAINQAGASSQTQALTVKTTDSGSLSTKGTVSFHLHLGVSSAQDKLALDGDNYTDLIMSNMVAGVMYGHLVDEYYPGIQFNKDYLYGSIMGQLLQENLGTDMYKASDDRIDPDPNQQAVMGVGQGGPYQINNYAADMVKGTYTPGGYSLINFITIQKNIGYTMADAPTQYTKATPASFNNKYYSPMLTAYFHYLDFVALNIIGKGDGGWTTPWQPAYDNALGNFKKLPNGFLDTLLNVAYNQGFYGPLMSRYSNQAATATASTVATVRAYTSVWGKTDTYEQYPYQVMYYLDQMYDNPIPTTNATTFVTPDNHIAFSMTNLSSVFSKVFQTMAYVNASGQYVYISSSQANLAFDTALTQAGVSKNATLDLSNAAGRAQIFSILEKAIGTLETNLGTKFNATTASQL